MKSEKLAISGGPRTLSLPMPKWPYIDEEEIAAVVKQLLTGPLSILGREGIVAEFEDAFASYMGSKYALSFSSGTATLHAAVFAAGVGPGDEVLTTSNTWASAVNAIMHGNGIPVFCDIVPDGFAIDPDEIRKKAGPRTKAVIVTHLYGIPTEMDEILEVAKDKNLVVIEDCSHCMGGAYKGKKVGTIGDIGCFSLQGFKSIVAGEGGVLVTDDRYLYERAMLPGHHHVRLEQELTYEDLKRYATCGMYWKYRAPPLAMALVKVQLKRLDEWNRNRRRNFAYLMAKIKDIDFLIQPKIPKDAEIGFFGSALVYDEEAAKGISREAFVAAVRAEGVPVDTGYKPWYLEPLFQDEFFYGRGCPWSCPYADRHLKFKEGDLPNTERMAKNQLLLPFTTSLIAPREDLMDQVSHAFHKVADNIDHLKDFKPTELVSFTEGAGGGGYRP